VRRFFLLGAILALIVGLAPAAAGAHPREDERTLKRYAADTWSSFEAMVFAQTGLPTDNIGGDLSAESRAKYTSPTNIGMYMWATLAARDLQLITPREARTRLATTIGSLERMERHEPSGQFYNWYDPATLAKLTVFPTDNSTVYPFLSSVDNGWLASALIMVSNAVPQLRDRAWTLATSMNFGCYYDPNALGPDAAAGLIRGGFWTEASPPPNSATLPHDDYCGMGEDVIYTGHHYGAFNTEPRIASYIGIALGQIPREHYFGPWRTFPNTCDWSWQEQQPVGDWTTYLGVNVFEGAYRYDDQRIVPTWGGSMFEALMVPLVVPEEQWGPRSWGVNHPLYVESQIEYGLDEAHYGYWGFSPASDPEGGYREYGVDAIGMDTTPGLGYTSDHDELTNVVYPWVDTDPALPDCNRQAQPITNYGQGEVTPHAAFLALDFDRQSALANLQKMEANFAAPGNDLYGPGGFKDSVNVATGVVANRYLSLDQGMIMAAIANELRHNRLQSYLATTLRPELQPLMAMEQFSAGRD
jgi:Putative glucoamylase/Protein of unknown function (DUF3131)